MWQNSKKYFLAMMLNGDFCICAGCCTVSPSSLAPAYFILRNFTTSLPIRTPPDNSRPKSSIGTVSNPQLSLGK